MEKGDLARSVLIVKAYSWAASSRPPKGMGRGSNKRLSHHSGTTYTKDPRALYKKCHES